MTGPLYSIPPRKEVERTQLAEAMTKFQRNGGKVDVLPSLRADKPPKYASHAPGAKQQPTDIGNVTTKTSSTLIHVKNK